VGKGVREDVRCLLHHACYTVVDQMSFIYVVYLFYFIINIYYCFYAILIVILCETTWVIPCSTATLWTVYSLL
jgi:hypothetical protein